MLSNTDIQPGPAARVPGSEQGTSKTPLPLFWCRNCHLQSLSRVHLQLQCRGQKDNPPLPFLGPPSPSPVVQAWTLKMFVYRNPPLALSSPALLASWFLTCTVLISPWKSLSWVIPELIPASLQAHCFTRRFLTTNVALQERREV